MLSGGVTLSWEQDIKRVFPNWQTEKGIDEFNLTKKALKIKQTVKGKVIVRAQFNELKLD
ncbi:MAG: hypothetical protein DRQ49_11475 [Gammaproteobacteria bacterium]|nr:MAG: hypothetical protein DRQ49_11475 [Gammaproteobacteria bacterium]RKZ73529.1 MAG: hypothetical protein DRQ57_14055 [Gammaproteobacteria bacterium]